VGSFPSPNGNHTDKGNIGTGLFVRSGKALAVGGPASLLIAFSLISFMLYCPVYALGELSCLFPIAGSFSTFATRFLDPAWGFAIGWNARFPTLPCLEAR
jgi:amino acid transporter